MDEVRENKADIKIQDNFTGNIQLILNRCRLFVISCWYIADGQDITLNQLCHMYLSLETIQTQNNSYPQKLY